MCQSCLWYSMPGSLWKKVQDTKSAILGKFMSCVTSDTVTMLYLWFYLLFVHVYLNVYLNEINQSINSKRHQLTHQRYWPEALLQTDQWKKSMCTDCDLNPIRELDSGQGHFLLNSMCIPQHWDPMDSSEHRNYQRNNPSSICKKRSSSASWIVYTSKLLSKYNLPSIIDIYIVFPDKEQWRKRVQKAIYDHAIQEVHEEAKTKSTLTLL